jgi:hypothetical protein
MHPLRAAHIRSSDHQIIRSSDQSSSPCPPRGKAAADSAEGEGGASSSGCSKVWCLAKKRPVAHAALWPGSRLHALCVQQGMPGKHTRVHQHRSARSSRVASKHHTAASPGRHPPADRSTSPCWCPRSRRRPTPRRQAGRQAGGRHIQPTRSVAVSANEWNIVPQ